VLGSNGKAFRTTLLRSAGGYIRPPGAPTVLAQSKKKRATQVSRPEKTN